MNKTYLLCLLFFSCSLQAQTLDDFYYQLPALVCHDETYLGCRSGESIATCTRGLVKFRDSCASKQKIRTMEALTEAMACMVLKHSKVSTVEEFEKKCNGGMNINITKAKSKLEAADPDWVLELLQ